MAASNRLHGVLVIDKPVGPTSHDVVARLRKALGTRAVGHAGTLDPAATGVLVVAVGEATKLSAYLTAQAKQYQATVSFGIATTTLDAEGDVVATAPIPDDLARELRALAGTELQADAHSGVMNAFPSALTAHAVSIRPESVAPALARALDIERARLTQIPPAFSAIKTGGHTAHKLARRGEEVALAPRAVAVSAMAISDVSATTLGLVLTVSKGYYVRALARDLGQSLGVPSHLSALRRTASGTFTLADALPWTATTAELESALWSVERAARHVLPANALTEEGQTRARCGKRLQAEHFAGDPTAEMSAWFGAAGELVAVGRLAEDGSFKVERGFGYETSTVST